MVDNRVAPSVTTPPSSKTVKLSERIVLSCTATGNPTPNIRWYKDGKAIEGPLAIGNEFVIPEVTPHKRGFYQCEAFSSFGKPARSAEAVILIQGWSTALCTHDMLNVSNSHKLTFALYQTDLIKQVLSKHQMHITTLILQVLSSSVFESIS